MDQTATDKTVRQTGGDCEALLALLGQQQSLFRRLRMLAGRQKALIVQEDMEPLLGLLAERQALVDELVLLNSRLAPYRVEWTAVFGRMDESVRRRITGMLEEANETLSGILQNDSRDTATLTARQTGTVERMATMHQTSQAAAAYSSASAYSSGGGVWSSGTDARG